MTMNLFSLEKIILSYMSYRKNEICDIVFACKNELVCGWEFVFLIIKSRLRKSICSNVREPIY